LRVELAGRRTLVIGHSGVGKSTLLNALAPDLLLRIGEVNARTGKGRHTTTAATLARLAPGPPPTEVIDTPGVRTFGLPPIAPEALPRLFPEWRGRGPCRFADCAHRSEPGCAMTAALAEGAIAGERYRSYLRLREELEAAHMRRTTGRIARRPPDPRKATR
jgi:ribosome biogenesis GTPase